MTTIELPISETSEQSIPVGLPIPEKAETSRALNGNRQSGWGKFTQCQIAKTLFSCPDFAGKPFSQMDIQDWKVQASRAWDIAWVFVMAQRYDGFSDPAKEKDPDKFETDGRKERRLISQVDDLLAFIPTDSIVLRKDLYEQTRGKIARDDFRSYLDQLLREERIFAHGIQGRTHPLIAYSRFPAESDTEITKAEKLMSRPRGGHRNRELERIAGE